MKLRIRFLEPAIVGRPFEKGCEASLEDSPLLRRAIRRGWAAQVNKAPEREPAPPEPKPEPEAPAAEAADEPSDEPDKEPTPPRRRKNRR